MKKIKANGLALAVLFTIAIACIVLIITFISGNIQHPTPVPPTTEQSASSILAVTSSSSVDTFPVTRVVDGDTIIVSVKNPGQNKSVDESVRLIGVNTPETVDPRKPVQCFGKEASDFLKTILTGKSVRLVADPTQGDRDIYGRLLRYVYLNDILINEEIIQEGYGFEYTYYKNGQLPYQFREEFKASEAYARAGSLGLWATTTCNGQLKMI